MLERVLYHDHCFDGAASAAIFSRLIAGTFHPDAEFRYTGMAHQASQRFDPALFDGDENAIVDFKYSSNPRLTWWFDHHQSAFLNHEDAVHYQQDSSGPQIEQIMPRLYNQSTLILGLALGILALGFVLLYRAGPAAAPQKESHERGRQ